MKKNYRANVFIKFTVDDERVKAAGLDINMPAGGILHDDLMELLDGVEGITEVLGVVVKDCAPLPSPLSLEVVQTTCEGCGLLKETQMRTDGRLCASCNGSVVPLRRKNVSTHPAHNRPNS